MDDDVNPAQKTGYAVLLVDDDQNVLTMVQRFLTRAGHTVIACTSFAEAQEKLVDGLEPDLLLTDVVLGKSTGKRVASAVQQLCPKTRIAFMSGYPNIAVGAPVLPKPFTREQLLSLIEEAMSADHADESPRKKLH